MNKADKKDLKQIIKYLIFFAILYFIEMYSKNGNVFTTGVN